jgi:hypothetical protein
MARQRYEALLPELARLLASGSTYGEVATTLRISKSTAGRWARLATTKTVVEQIGDRSTPAQISAIGTLQALLLSADERVRLQASALILGNKIETVPVAEIEDTPPTGKRYFVIGEST